MTTNSASGIGSSSITTLGTIGTGTWQGSSVGVQYGGTGSASFTPYSVICGGTTSTGALQNVSGVGNANQVLTSNGPGALPTWQTGSSGGLVKITSVTASNQATVEFNSQFSSTYDCYMFTFTNVIPVTNAVTMYCQVGTGSTPTWTTTGYYWNASICQFTSLVEAHNQNDSVAQLASPLANYPIQNTLAGVCGYIYITGPNGSASFVTGCGKLIYPNSFNNIPTISSINFMNASATYTSIKFYFSSGNVNTGTICMYGVRSS